MEQQRRRPNFDIMKTADDAVRVKAAAVHTGYYDDPYVDAFATTKSIRPVHVIIKRGTFARVKCVERVIRSFMFEVLQQDDIPQVVLLGAGKDTALFRLRDMFSQEPFRWYEVDQEEMIRQKMHIVRANPDLFHSSGVSQLETGGDSAKEIYRLSQNNHNDDDDDCTWNAHFIVHDFIQDTPTALTTALVERCGLDPKAPTLIITECVQMYLPVHAVDALLKSFLSNPIFKDVGLCSYEPILQSDAFGHVMETNLRKAHLLTEDAACVLVQRRTIPELSKAFQLAGAVQGVACNMNTAYESVLIKSQRERARTCEFLDELEEWNLIMKHYCLIVATNRKESVVGTKLCGENSAAGFPGSSDGSVYRFGA